LSLISSQLSSIPPPTLSSVSLPVLPSEETQWYYKDPQGNEHGPFTSQQMNEWFKHDFFGVDLR
jgi:PERQ amino acid-rich with GYF domain-containing protein